MSNTDSRNRIAGILLIFAALLIVFTMGHHPSHSHGDGWLNRIVHGGMLVLLTVAFTGLVRFAQWRGLDRLTVMSGLLVYSISAFAHVIAAMMNGFIVPAVHASGAEAGHDIFMLGWQINQMFARLGVYATGAAFVLWSADLLVRDGLFGRIIGVVGLAAALGPTIALLMGQSMNVPVAFASYAAHSLWMILVGVLLVKTS